MDVAVHVPADHLEDVGEKRCIGVHGIDTQVDLLAPLQVEPVCDGMRLRLGEPVDP